MSGNENSEASKPAEDTLDRIKFDYIKSNYFRVVHADGVFGGLTPRLDIHMDIWSQRHPIPKQVVHKVTADGTLGNEIERTARDAIVREVEVGVVIDLDTAKSMAEWLQDKIRQIEVIRKGKSDKQEHQP